MKQDRSTTGTSEWYRTDNAGRIFASLYRWRTTSVFRISANLRQPVSLSRLEASVARVMSRFPYFNVHLRQGVFWCFFEPDPAPPPLRPDSRYPCNEFHYRHRQSAPFRIRVFHKRIALEVAHVLTDGTGAVMLLQSILAEYLGFEGESPGLFRPGQTPDPEEMEDAFRRYHRPGLPPMPRKERAFKIPGELEHRGIRHITTGIFSVPEVLQLARENHCTIGEFFIAAYLFSLYELFAGLPREKRRRLARPIRLDVPVNLRTHLPSKTMRNFFLPTYPEIDPRLGEYEFDEVARGVHHFMKGVLREKYFLQMIGRNVGAEQNLFLRGVPLFVKNLILPEIYSRWNLSVTTSGFSNLGRITLPEDFADQVTRFDFVPTHPSTRGISCGMVSYGDKLHLCFNRILTEPIVERGFFRFLTRMGLNIRIETNDRT